MLEELGRVERLVRQLYLALMEDQAGGQLGPLRFQFRAWLHHTRQVLDIKAAEVEKL